MLEPLPCPWCGGPTVVNHNRAAVACSDPSCGAWGPCGLDDADGIAAWNRVSARPDREVMDLLRECADVLKQAHNADAIAEWFTDTEADGIDVRALLARLARALGEGR